MNNITITVSGQSGSGKSTIAEIINRALEVHGFYVHVKQQDHHEKPLLCDLYKRIAALSEKETYITILEKQEKR